VRIEKPAFIIIKENQKEIFSVLKDCFLFIFVLKEKNPNASFLSSSIF
jgi:hypothetical protein